MKNTTITNYQIKIDSRSNLTRLKRRFAETNEAFAKRFAANLNKHFDYYINGEITKLIERLITELIKRFDCQVDGKTTESKAANINYQDLHFAKTEIKIAVVNEVDTDQNYPYCYHSNFEKERHSLRKKSHVFSNYACLRRSTNHI